jgi:hypothetical protein
MRNLKILLLSMIVVAVIPTLAMALVVGGKSLKETPLSVTSISAKDMDLRVTFAEESLIDQVELNLGKKWISNSELGVVPNGWTCNTRGGSYVCNGPPTNHGHLSIRGLRGGFDTSKKVGLGLYLDGQRLFNEQMPVMDIERVEVLRGPQGVLYPTDVRAGESFVVTPETHIPGGKWSFQVGGVTYDPIDPGTLGFDDSDFPENRFIFQMPEDAGDDDELQFNFTGPFGDPWVETIPLDYFWGGVDARECDANLAACQDLTVVGDQVCVCGCFPVLSWTDLTLDGAPIPVPTTTSVAMVRIPLPAGTAPGTHTIALPKTGQSVQFEVVQAQGSIDQALLQVGQSTELKFGLVGTERILPMEISLVEGAVRISGGNKQTAHTTGGSDNSFTRILNAEGVGDFGIDYRFVAGPCPCSGKEYEGLVDDSFMTKPVSMEGSLGSEFLSGGKGEFPLDFRSDSVIAYTPYLPLDPGGFEMRFAQLGLRGTTPGFGEFVFEAKVDEPSVGRARDLELTDEGGFRAGNVGLELYTEFSVPLTKKLPLKVGKTYELSLSNFNATGKLWKPGDLSLQYLPDEESSVRFDNIKKDKAGKNLYGDATFRMSVRAEVKF